MPKIFFSRRGAKSKEEDALKSALYQQIGQLKVELDWLKKQREQRCLLAVDLGDDVDTIGAVYGQLAGAPSQGRQTLHATPLSKLLIYHHLCRTSWGMGERSR